MPRVSRFLPLAAVAAILAIAPGLAPQDKKMSPLEFKMKDIDGKEVDLAKYKGEVLLIVNSASFCGLTPQYKGLESAYEKYKEKGFEVLAFPANEFGAQEPGTDAEIKQFCTGKYNVTFPVFSKIVVKGDGIHPLYKSLTTTETKYVPAKGETKEKGTGDIKWNFEKFLVNRKGEVIARFEPQVKPDDPKVVAEIEKALAEAK